MSEVIKGQDVIVDIYKGDNYYPWVCAENMTMTKTGVAKSVKTIGDGPNDAYRMQRKGYTFSVNGLIPYDDLVNVTAFDVLDRYENMLTVPFRMVWRNQAGVVVKAIYGTAYVTELSFTGPTDFAGASINFLGSGPTTNYDGLTACDAVIATLILNSQTDTTATFGYSGATLATRFDYIIQQGAFIVGSGSVFTPGASGSFAVGGLTSNGSQTITITPVCASGFNGTNKSLIYTKT